MEHFLSVNEVVDLLGVAKVTLNKMIREGRFPKADFGGGQGSLRRWKQSTYNKWCEQDCKNGSQTTS